MRPAARLCASRAPTRSRRERWLDRSVEPRQSLVFIDWQNAYKAAREAFALRSLPNERGNFSPFKLARILVAGHKRGENAMRLSLWPNRARLVERRRSDPARESPT